MSPVWQGNPLSLCQWLCGQAKNYTPQHSCVTVWQTVGYLMVQVRGGTCSVVSAATMRGGLGNNSDCPHTYTYETFTHSYMKRSSLIRISNTFWECKSVRTFSLYMEGISEYPELHLHQMENKACPEMHPPRNFCSVYSSIKWFLIYTDKTSMSNQSKFHACGTFLVRVSGGCISWQDRIQPCP